MRLKELLMFLGSLLGRNTNKGSRDAGEVTDATEDLNVKHQSPQAYIPPNPVRYPDDYCENFKETDEFDYVVVGAGPGGATVARRLAEDASVKVLILEAGGDPPPQSDIPGKTGMVDPSQRWDFHSVEGEDLCLGYKQPYCSYAPGKLLGGSSVINGMMYVRGNAKDFDDWEKIGCSGWSYKDVLPYFIKSEKYSVRPLLTADEIKNTEDPNVADKKYHGTKGPLHHSAFPPDPATNAFREAIQKAQIENGIEYNPDINGAKQTGVTDLGGMVDPLGYRNSIARAFLLHIPDNLKVCKFATAMKINVEQAEDEEELRAVGIEFQYNGTGVAKNFKTKAKREYIISAGPFNSAPLLERSGIGRDDVIEKLGIEQKLSLPGVGENYQDHLLSGLLFRGDFLSEAATNPLSNGILPMTSFINSTDPESQVPDVQFIVFPLAKEIIELLGIKKEIADQLQAINQSVFYFNAVHLRQPNPGSLHITQVEDPTITPEIKTNHLTTDLEQERIVKATHLIRKFMSSEVLKPYNVAPVVIKPCQKHKFNTKDEIICQMRHLTASFYHVVGLTSMGPRDNPNSVVDPELRLIGVENVRVIDSGVMPLVTRGNTEIPTVMIAEKGADMMKKFWKKAE